MALVTVLMAVRDGAPFLREAVESVLAQEGADFDVVIVDDGSIDETPAILSSFDDCRVTVLTNDAPQGLTVSLNRGLSRANGRFIARMDADDLCLRGRLRNQLRLIEANGADICFGRSVDDEGNKVWKEKPWAFIQWRGLFENAYGPHPAVMFRRASIEAVGGYDETFPLAQDYDLWDRCVVKGLGFVYSPHPAIRYRRHAGAVTQGRQSEQDLLACRVSDRAICRSFPDMEAEERGGLRWLMTGRGSQPDPGTVGLSLIRLETRIQSFGTRVGGLAQIWGDVSGRLTRRFRDLSPSHRSLAGALLRLAAIKSLSPRAFVRAWRARRNVFERAAV